MRKPMKAVLTRHIHTVGRKIRAIVDAFLNQHPELQASLLAAIGRPKDAGPQFNYDDPLLHELRAQVGQALNAEDIDEVDNGDCTTPLRGGLIKAWALEAHDPAINIVPWLLEGAPAGIKRPIPDMGIFPTRDNAQPTMTVEQVQAMEQADTNYKSLEDDSEAEQLVNDMIDTKKKWVKDKAYLKIL